MVVNPESNAIIKDKFEVHAPAYTNIDSSLITIDVSWSGLTPIGIVGRVMDSNTNAPYIEYLSGTTVSAAFATTGGKYRPYVLYIKN